MDLRWVPVTLAELWDDLPRLVGPAWTDLFPRVSTAVRRLANAHAGERPQRVVELTRVFQPYPKVSTALRTALEGDAAARNRSGSALPPDWETIASSLLDHLDGRPVTRYTEVFATQHLTLGEPGMVAVRLTAEPTTPQAQSGRVSRGRIEVHLSSGAGVTVEGDQVRPLTLMPDATTDFATFRLLATAQGTHPVRLDLRQSGRLVATVGFTVTVTLSPPPAGREPGRLPPLAVAVGGASVPPPDLHLRVILEPANGQTTLRYVLHSPNGAAAHHYEPAGEVTLVGTPGQEQARLMRRIEHLSAAEADDKLRAFGERLYREVLSPQLRQAYGRFRESVRSLQVTSDEPWVPWELVRPFDDAVQPAVDDDFWAARFDLARWLAGSNGPAGRLDVHRLACAAVEVSPGHPPLPAATAEHRFIADLAARHDVTDASPPAADRPAIAALLTDRSIQLWHFACHGDIDPDYPDESLLVLARGQTWQAEDLHGPLQAAVAQARPLVFLNACRVAQQGWSLTRLGGWVDAWVRRCRCGAFLGPQWSVTDTAAADFARAFYGGIEGGQAMAAAVRAAREVVRTKYPGDPTWLAYSLYAHPHAYVRFGPPSSNQDPIPSG